MLGLGLSINKNKKSAQIVRNGLVLYLDGKDFTNSPPTASWKDRSLSNSYVYHNELQYTPTTWAEWDTKTNVVGDSTGLEFTFNTPGTTIAKISATTFKNSTKYGILLNVVSNTMATNNLQLYSNLTGSTSVIVGAGQTGNIKATITTLASIASQFFALNQSATGDNGLRVKIKDVRIFELPSGSQIETDFNTLTADQLTLKYPMQPKGTDGTMMYGNNATPSGFAYTTSSGSNNVGGVVFDGVNDTIVIPNGATMTQMYRNGVLIASSGTFSTAGTTKNIVGYNRTLSANEIARNLKVLG